MLSILLEVKSHDVDADSVAERPLDMCLCPPPTTNVRPSSSGLHHGTVDGAGGQSGGARGESDDVGV